MGRGVWLSQRVQACVAWSWSLCRHHEGENLEDRLSYLGEPPDIPDSREISFRLLRHYASSVRHQKYHGVDIVTVSVDGSR